jgi:uncharacterized membrane protein YeaQ/YmgE (transglycosylase-associated protein family)
MLEVVVWVLFGALAGWVTSLLIRTADSGRALQDSAIGVVGAVIGGAVYRFYRDNHGDGIESGGLVAAVIGAVIVLVILEFIRQK